MATAKKAATAAEVKKANELKISTIGDFKARLGGLMELPSGLVVRAHNPGGLNAFLEGGNIPNALMGSVSEALDMHKSGSKAKTEEEQEAALLAKLKDEPEIMGDMLAMIDNVTMRVIVEPTVHPVPTDGVEREEDTLYVDEVPSQDKQFLFKWITSGVTDLEPFRK